MSDSGSTGQKSGAGDSSIWAQIGFLTVSKFGLKCQQGPGPLDTKELWRLSIRSISSYGQFYGTKV